MKRFLLMSILSLLTLSVTVGYEEPNVEKAVVIESAYTALQPGVVTDFLIVNVAYAIDSEPAETGEVLPLLAPDVIWQEIVLPVDVQPPIASPAKLFDNTTAWKNSQLPSARVTGYSHASVIPARLNV